MTHNEFNHLRHIAAALPPEQMRQLRDELDRKLAEPKKRPATPTGKSAKRTSRAEPKKKPLFHRRASPQVIAPAASFSAFCPTLRSISTTTIPMTRRSSIEGEPLSETILRERR